MDETVCPHCGGEDMHIAGVVVFARDKEDGDATVTTVILPPDFADDGTVGGRKAGTSTTRMNASRVPGRRSSVILECTCEHCDQRSHLEILQHKGKNLVSWQHKGKNLVSWHPKKQEPR